jgi:hypothetical protein
LDAVLTFGAGDPVFAVLFFGGLLFFAAACLRAWKTRRFAAESRAAEGTLDTPDAEACRDACAENVYCRAWTYVKPDPGKKERGWCQFQSDTPKPVWDQCCVSGEIRR